MRFKVLEERLKPSSGGATAPTARIPSEAKSMSNGHARRRSLGGGESLSRASSYNGFSSRKVSTPPNGGLLRSNSGGLTLKPMKASPGSFNDGCTSPGHNRVEQNGDASLTEKPHAENEDSVSGILYDMLQKEVITLRKACQDKEQSVKEKDDAIQVGWTEQGNHHLSLF